MQYMRRAWPLYAMIVPGIIFVLLFRYYPCTASFIAFQDFSPAKGFAGSPWIGWENFEYLFSLPEFGAHPRQYRVHCGGKDRRRPGGRDYSGAAAERGAHPALPPQHPDADLPALLPVLGLCWAASCWTSSRHTASSIKPSATSASTPSSSWAATTGSAPTIISSGFWKNVGFFDHHLPGGADGDKPDLHSRHRRRRALPRIWHITCPGIRPTIVLLAALSLGDVLDAGFEQILTLYSPAVYRTGDIIDTYVYRRGIVSAQHSLAGAVGLFKSFHRLLPHFAFLVSG